METATLTDVPAAHQGNDKIWSILSHLSALLGVGFVLPLVVYLAMRKESEFVAANAREALNFHISVLIYSICCIPLVFILIGIPLLFLIGIGHHCHGQSVQRRVLSLSVNPAARAITKRDTELPETNPKRQGS